MGECDVPDCHRPAYTERDGVWLCAVHYDSTSDNTDGPV